ncbi:putative poly(A) polymerase [Xylariomycetidae sp. FL2044]|nr:putative poly(A) polymerase [Xylariomycetidae sp. FL2044]
MAEGRRTIALLPSEALLREFLLECAQHFPGLEIWITGGWVRDRLLDIPSADLDIALSHVTGREFGKFLEAFSATPEIESKYSKRATELGIPDARFTKFHLIKRNAAALKKLETAGGKLFGLDVDLVNLRKEVYDGQSRNPDMVFGTAEEDAFRRDAAANALFFHLERREVVDLTGRGLRDLDARILTTPLDPHQTFMDDPLRVLRFIRLGSKLGFAIHPEALRCMKRDDTRRSLDTMIIRDRINAEVFKMMRGPNPAVAFQHLFKCNLYAPVFLRLDSPLLRLLQTGSPTLGSPESTPWPGTWPRSYRLLDLILKSQCRLSHLIKSEDNCHLWVMAAYAPIAALRHNKLQEAIQEMTNAIRAPTKVSKILEAALRNFDSIQSAVDMVTARPANAPLRSAIGMSIRSWGLHWRAQLTYVILAHAVYASPSEFPDDNLPNDELNAWPQLRRYLAFAEFVCDEDLADAYLQCPLLKGNEIQVLFGLQKGGKFLKHAIKDLIAWQFDHVEGTIEEAKAWLIDQRERWDIPPELHN